MKNKEKKSLEDKKVRLGNRNPRRAGLVSLALHYEGLGHKVPDTDEKFELSQPYYGQHELELYGVTVGIVKIPWTAGSFKESIDEFFQGTQRTNEGCTHFAIIQTVFDEKVTRVYSLC